MLLHFDGPVNMTVNWRAFLDGRTAINFTREPQFYFGVVLQRLFQYNDKNQDAHFESITDPSDIVQYNLQDFTWTREYLNVSQDKAEIRVNAQRMVTKGSVLQSDPIGNISLTLSTFGISGHSPQIPHLLHTENATEIDLILKDIRVEHDFTCPRMAVEVTLIAMEDERDKPKGNFSLNIRRSVDDEFTPGIFELINLSSRNKESNKVGKEGFVQYRPVSYTDAERDVSTSTLVRQSNPMPAPDDVDPLSETIFASIQGVIVQRAVVENMNVSFGVKGDGCYDKTNYTTWTFVTAYGEPMPERLSTLVVILAALGLGIPLILLISGGCFVCLRRARAQ